MYLLSFGASMYSDNTIHKDEVRQHRCITRHKKNEGWTTNRVQTAGFWSKHLLWNLPTLQDSIRDVKKRFYISVKLI